MDSIPEFLQLCRLCLMKDEVNTPIFEDEDDISQIFLKISACLHIKVSRKDSLPKNICDSCTYKLELFYEFLNTSTASEKQLLTWLNQLDTEEAPSKAASSNANPTSVILKQELPELLDAHSVDLGTDDLNISETRDYVLQQQQLPYESVDFEFQQGFMDSRATTNVATTTSSKRVAAMPNRKRRAASLKALKSMLDSDDDTGLVRSKITKTEGDHENNTDRTFGDLPSESGDNDQPGPSGVGKTATDAPFRPLTAIVTDAVHQAVYECEVCTETFPSKKDFLAHHMNQFGQTLTCCRCNLQCKTATELFNHYELHKNNTIIIEGDNDSRDFDYSENVEHVLSIPSEPTNEDNELLYILDGSQCVNEIVIEDDDNVQEVESSETSVTNSDNFRIVHVEHGYMLPSIFKGQLETKRRYTRKESVTEVCSEVETEKDISEELTLARNSYLNIPKARPKRRHEVPDFSATTYIVLNPNEEIDMMHYKCLRCEQLFISKFGFFRHIEKGKCYINSCDVCSASFLKNSEFYEHYLAEHTDRAICNFCFRTFMYEKNVKEHMLRHLDQFRHRCEECNKGFYTVREYRNHYKNRHMGIRHKCELCGRSFADEYYFKRHVATHEKAVKK